MDSVDLKSGNYDGSYKLISGGEISLDFVNTISWPDTIKEHDWLDRPENVTAWAVAADIISDDIKKDLDKKPKNQLREELNHVHDIRGDLTNILRPLTHNEQPVSSALGALNKLIREVAQHRYLANDYHWIWDDPHTLTETLNPVIWNAAHVLTELDHTRLGHCPSCSWIFYDTTRNRSRKWCDMQDCGSRDKALRYYHRSKSTDDS